ncbi:MAG: hypothetical protein H6Q89_697 [Myxococcaceae bacterium]|nr:hypothetical protein [Myxococcaceae bacterium]
MSFSRRRFLGGSAVLIGSLNGAVAAAQKPGSPDLVDVEGLNAAAMTQAAIAGLGGIGAFVKPGDYVVLKANAGFANPAAWATTTNPEVVAAVAKLCLDAKAKQVVLLEYPQGKGEKCLERCGVGPALAAFPAVKVKLLTPADFQEVKVPGAVTLATVEVAKLLMSADVFINIPVGKNHTDAGVSFGLKNHMGLIKNRRAFHQEHDLHQAVADLGRVIKPHLTVLDATRVLLTNGPAGPGDVGTPNRIVAGRNVVSVDCYGLGLARYGNQDLTLADVRYLQLAGKAGLGETDVKKLQVKKLTV